MTSSILRTLVPRTALATITTMSWTGAAFASQGPGGGLGTAGHLTQVAMAVLVYGASAIVIGAGLIGVVRGR